MAKFSIVVQGEAIAAATVETLLTAKAGSIKQIRITKWGISFAGADSTKTPVRVELLRVTSDGTSSSYTPKKLNPADDAPIASGRTAYTAEPTVTDVIEAYYVSPAGGSIVGVYAPDEVIVVPANIGVGIRVLANDATTVSAFIIFDE